MVLPGFHDSHIHPISGGMRALSCSLVEAPTIDAILAKVRDCAARPRTDAQGWLIGAGWDLSLFPAANPHRSMLDAVVPDRPVFLEGADGHSAWVNSRALAIAGIDRSTPDPGNGVIERDRASGEPSGTLRESAAALVSSRLPPPSSEDRRAGLRHALRSAASFGITAMIDPGVDQDNFETYVAADTAGELTARVLACARPLGVRAGVHGSTTAESAASESEADPEVGGALGRRGLDAVARLRKRASGASERLDVGCLKIFVDGVLEGETAALLEPYLERGDHRGILNVEPRALEAAVTQWDAERIQVHFHAIGDRAVRVALDAIEAARRANGARDARHHLAHLQLVGPADVPRFGALDATATFQALWAYPDTYIENVNLAQVGPERVARMYPIGGIHRAGGRIAAGSDWPVTSMNPLLAIEVALTRQDPAGGDADTLNASERVDLDTMLAAFTAQGAWLMRQEKSGGSIEVGRHADLVVLDRDLFAIPPSEIGEVRVERTIFAGKTVFTAAVASPN
ncbi:MAG TPA: amidohydrolase, partial [Thermoanaerobaculia bacterium]|nr:amidohydrolase [Thermoanaerobaculia bacterium]